MAELVAYDTGDDSAAEQYGDVEVAQTFTISSAATLSGIDVLVYREGTPGTVSVGLYTTDVDGKPDSFVRSTGFNGDALTEDTAGEWKSIAFSGGQLVAAGVYAIRISGGDDVSNSVHWREDSSSPSYAGGSRIDSVDNGVNWTIDTTSDLMFRVNGEYTYVFTPPAGRPTTKLLVGFAGSTLWYEDV